MTVRRTPRALALLLLLCAACAAPARRAPPPDAAPRIGVEREGRVFVPARPEPPPEPVATERALAQPEPAPPLAPLAPSPEPLPEVPVARALEVSPAALFEAGLFAEALSALGEPSEEWSPAPWHLRARALEALGRRPEAVWSYAEAVRGADEVAAEDLRARLRALLDGLDEGELVEVAVACPLCPEGGYARLRWARLRHAAGDVEEAEGVLVSLAGAFAGDPLGRAAEALRAEWAAARSVTPGLYGVLLPLSGSLQSIGERALRGALLASGLLAEGADPGFRLAVRDSRGEPGAAGQAVRELAAQGVMGIVGPLKGSAAAEAARVARELGVPLVAPTPAPEAAGGGAFRLYLREEDEVARLAEYAVRARGLRRFAILYPDVPLGRRYRDLFWAAVVDQGGEVTGVEPFAPSSRDQGDAIRRLTGVFGLSAAEIRERFVERERERLLRERELLVALGLVENPEAEIEVSVDLERLAKYKPEPIVDFDAVFLPVSGLEAAQIAPQFPFHDVERVALLGIRTWNYPTLVQVGQEYVAGALIPAEFHPSLPEAREFAAAYQREYGEPPGVIEAYVHDAVRLLASSTSLLGPETRPGLRRRLEALWAAPGVTGPLTTHPNGDIAAQPKILIVDKGRIAPAP